MTRILTTSIAGLRHWLRPWRDPHRTYVGLSVAASKSGWRVIRVPMPPMRLLSLAVPRYIALFIAHLRLAWRIRARTDRCIVREFLTIPLLLTMPIWWRSRSRCLFVINHNLQSASRRAIERAALLAMQQWGVRFLLCENSTAWADALRLDDTKAIPGIFCVPFPVAGTFSPGDPAPRRTLPRIGVIGAFRPEKNPTESLNLLYEAIQSGRILGELVVGCPDRSFRNSWEGKALTIDTTSEAGYAVALRSCDVVVFFYDRLMYFYRTSGVVIDAIRHGCVVVCPNYPAMRSQIMEPTPVGAVYNAADDLVEAVIRAIDLALSPTAGEAFTAYRAHRSPERVASLLRDILP